MTTTPANATTQPATSPTVEWLDNRPFCICGTALNTGSTVGPKHDAEARPTRVSVCPVCEVR